jgi:membrane protein implicated in regulation of membrane protease activity
MELIIIIALAILLALLMLKALKVLAAPIIFGTWVTYSYGPDLGAKMFIFCVVAEVALWISRKMIEDHRKKTP